MFSREPDLSACRLQLDMRELRKDIESTLESSKEELDGMDEMKIEEVLMGLKGLKQEEVFSFLGKNNFTPSETEVSIFSELRRV